MSYRVAMLSLFVHDVRRSTEFYSSVLGFQLQPEFSHEGFAVGRLASGPAIALCSLDQLPPDIWATPGGIEIQFEVEDIEGAWKTWKAYHVTDLTDIFDMGPGIAFSGKDPDGHRLAVIHLYIMVNNA